MRDLMSGVRISMSVALAMLAVVWLIAAVWH